MKNKGQKTKDRRQWSVPILDQRGSAIIITVLIVTILVALVVEFAYEVYIDTAALSNWTNAQKASFIAKSGQTLSSTYIKEVNNIYNTQSEIEFPVEMDLGPNTHLFIKIEDEDARFNINNIIHEKGITNDQAFLSLKNLFEYLNINTQLALVIADWIDPDSEPREGLSESEDNAKNTYLSTLDELKLIKGIDKDVFDKISPYLTVHEDRTRVKRFETLVNINTAKLPVLISLHKNMTEALAQQIIDYRETSPFESKGQLNNITGMQSPVAEFYPPISFKSSTFRVTSKVFLNDITRVIESVIDRSMKIQFWREQ